MLTAKLVHPQSLSSSELQAWESFRRSDSALANPLLGPRWAQAVGRVRTDAAVAVFQRNGAVLGFLPHQRSGRGLARPMGAPFSDLQALIVEPGQALSLSEAVSAAGLGAFSYSGLLDSSGEATGAGGRAIAHVVVQTGDEDLAEAVRARNPKRFKNWRRLRQKLDREHGPTEVIAHDPSLGSYERLLGWKRAQLRRSGLHDVYRPAWVQQLLRDLMAASDPEFGGYLVSLRGPEGAIAGEFGLRENGCFHPWLAGYDPAFSAYSPGILLQLHIVEHMKALGLRRYDLGPGSDHYKTPMANHQVEIFSGVATSGGRPPELWPSVLGGSRLGARVAQRWDQIAAVETTLVGRLQGVATAVRDGPRRLAPGA